ncbi:hypothetical protein CDD82_836 [Ophiocordyceps australis]|uniref:Uncharacterized protein n=1 Tax=Ophiocordyceps australis TaxID=1399860 RepID=A0A2C5YLD2_9HYPO|nr:hypothetical protein CDD82_836 [Ophiocordyceps australis]
MMMPKMMHLMALIAMFLGIALAAEPEAGATSRAGAEKAAPTPGQAEAEPGSPATSGAGSPGATPPAGSPARSSGGPGASAPGGGSSLSKRAADR